MADTFSLPITPQQFDAARAAIANSDQVVAFTTNGNNDGEFSTTQVDLAYTHDPAAASILFTINARHGLAKFAGVQVIKSHVADLIGQVRS